MLKLGRIHPVHTIRVKRYLRPRLNIFGKDAFIGKYPAAPGGHFIEVDCNVIENLHFMHFCTIAFEEGGWDDRYPLRTHPPPHSPRISSPDFAHNPVHSNCLPIVKGRVEQNERIVTISSLEPSLITPQKRPCNANILASSQKKGVRGSGDETRKLK